MNKEIATSVSATYIEGGYYDYVEIRVNDKTFKYDFVGHDIDHIVAKIQSEYEVDGSTAEAYTQVRYFRTEVCFNDVYIRSVRGPKIARHTRWLLGDLSISWN